MDELTVTAYNVLFGDALLLAIPERFKGKKVTRHIMIDLGNSLLPKSGREDLFLDVAKDVRRRLDGRPIDLYVMTHEHLDHVKGLKFLDSQGIKLEIDQVWLTASARPGYYSRFPDAKRRLDLYNAEYDQLRLNASQLGLLEDQKVASLLAINDFRSTGKCVDFIRRVGKKKPVYVHRTFPLRQKRHHPFTEAQIEIWAPELRTTNYYGRFQPLVPMNSSIGNEVRNDLTPPPGVDGKAFKNLLAYLHSGLGDNMLAIDRARNNTSIVLCIEWRGWRLLFAGDAERRSWLTLNKMMEKSRTKKIRPVHFLKVSHHGSLTGSPPDQLLDKILPVERGDYRKRCALVSTYCDTHNGVPDELTLNNIQERVDEVFDTRNVNPGEGLTITFPG